MSQSARLKIRQLRALLDDGLLSSQEFEQRKNAILDAQLAPSNPRSPLVANAEAAMSTELGLMAGQELGPLNKRFRLERLIGQGGMGQVWQALDLATHAELGHHEQVALKILPPQLTQSALHTKLLVEEATQARKLAHEHIVRVYEWAQDPATTSYFLVMELLEGRDLLQHLQEKGPLSAAEVHRLLVPVAQGLRYAWDKHQLVHRDLKPSNLFLTHQGEIKLLDFGIATSVHASACGLQLPANAGTQGYRAPEAGQQMQQAAPQMDVYSVAVMIYQLLAGQLPFGPQLSNGQNVTAPPGLNPAQWRILQKGFAEKAQERPATVLELLTTLQQAGAALHLEHPLPPVVKPAAIKPLATELAAREQAVRMQSQQQAVHEAKLLQERKREQQEKQQKQQEARERAAQQLKRVALAQQKQMQEAKAREEAQLQEKRRARELAQSQAMQQRLAQKVTALAAPEEDSARADLVQFLDQYLDELLATEAPVASAMEASHSAKPEAVEALEHAVGSHFHDQFLDGSGVGPEMVVIPSGRFLMGSPESERAAALKAGAQRAMVERETPQHWVQIGQALAIAQFPVTVEQWRRFAQETGWQDDSQPPCPPPDFAQDDSHPVVCVSWQDANLYVAWLAQKTGQRYRLPSESEWEYACRAGSQRAFHCGDVISPEQANYDGNFTFNGSAKGQFVRGTSRVGSYAPNAWGVYDMHGNVWEWVADAVHENYQGAPIDGSAWQEGGDRGRRILRGGCWLYNPRYLRSAMRNAFWYAGKNDIVGFRVVRELTAANDNNN